jgi:hypothetical protein
MNPDRLQHDLRAGASKAIGVTCRPRPGSRLRGHQRALLPRLDSEGHSPYASSARARLPKWTERVRIGLGWGRGIR